MQLTPIGCLSAPPTPSPFHYNVKFWSPAPPRWLVHIPGKAAVFPRSLSSERRGSGSHGFHCSPELRNLPISLSSVKGTRDPKASPTRRNPSGER